MAYPQDLALPGNLTGALAGQENQQFQDLVDALTAQQQPMPEPQLGFGDRFAQALQGFQGPRQRPRNDLDSFLTALLSGAAQGYSGTRVRTLQGKQQREAANLMASRAARVMRAQRALKETETAQGQVRDWQTFTAKESYKAGLKPVREPHRTPEEIAADAEAQTTGTLKAERRFRVGRFAPRPNRPTVTITNPDGTTMEVTPPADVISNLYKFGVPVTPADSSKAGFKPKVDATNQAIEAAKAAGVQSAQGLQKLLYKKFPDGRTGLQKFIAAGVDTTKLRRAFP